MKNDKITSVDFNEEKQGNANMVNDNNKTKRKSNAQKLVPILTVVIISLLVILLPPKKQKPFLLKQKQAIPAA